MIVSGTILVVLQIIDISKAQERWDYGSRNIKTMSWPGVCQTGEKQSPINIDTSRVRKKNNVDPFVLNGYGKRFFGDMSILRNNGRTIMFGYYENENARETTPWFTGGALAGNRYKFLQAHLHWGASNDKGSEHTLDDKHAAMEMHMVHWNTNKGQTLKDAVATGDYDSLAVLSTRFMIGKRNPKLDSFFQNIKMVSKQGMTRGIAKGVRLEDFLPENKNEFYRYNGSLTTPGCEEVVVWTIFKQHVEISEHQIIKLRNVTYHQSSSIDYKLSNNFRPSQDLNGRVVLEISMIKHLPKAKQSVAVAGLGVNYRGANSAVSIKIVTGKALLSLIFLHIVILSWYL